MTSLPTAPFGARPPAGCDVLALATEVPFANPAVATVTATEATSSIARRTAARHESRYCMLFLSLSTGADSGCLSGFAADPALAIERLAAETSLTWR